MSSFSEINSLDYEHGILLGSSNAKQVFTQIFYLLPVLPIFAPKP